VPPRTCEPDVEQPPLLGDLLVGPRATGRKLARLEPRQEDGVELEPLRAVVREQVDAAGRLARERAGASPRTPPPSRPERARDLDQQPQVLLPRLLALAERAAGGVEQPCSRASGARVVGEVVCGRAALQQLTRGVALEQRRALERDLRAANASSKSAERAFRR
jgi:hypothetical protein